jgi:hypothetical protein
LSKNPNPSLLDSGQIIKRAFDEENDRIRVDIESDVTLSGQQEVAINATEDSIEAWIKDGSGNSFSSSNPLPVEVVSQNTTNEEVISLFNEVSSVVSGISTTIINYTVPSGKTAYIQKADVSGTNIATYELYINNVLSCKKRTYFGNSLNETFVFDADSNKGILLPSNSVVNVKVLHNRPDLGDFNTRLQIILTT